MAIEGRNFAKKMTYSSFGGGGDTIGGAGAGHGNVVLVAVHDQAFSQVQLIHKSN